MKKMYIPTPVLTCAQPIELPRKKRITFGETKIVAWVRLLNAKCLAVMMITATATQNNLADSFAECIPLTYKSPKLSRYQNLI